MMTMPDHDGRRPLAAHAFPKSVMMTAVRLRRGLQRPESSPERAMGFSQSRRAIPLPPCGGGAAAALRRGTGRLALGGCGTYRAGLMHP